MSCVTLKPQLNYRLAPMAAMKAKRIYEYRPSKPQAVKKDLVKLAKKGSALASRRRKPHIFRERRGCKGLVLGQAPPGPRSSLPRGWRPLNGPAEQRLAKLAGLKEPADFWREFDRTNLLSWYPGLKKKSAKHTAAKGYKLHQSDGDVFPMADARMAASSLNLSQYRCVILLGNNVSRAFGVKAGLLEAEARGKTRLLTFPHPSGVSHYWNEPKNVRKASKVLKDALRRMRQR
eukprot:TRINITY_DN14038_c0_g1_i1.p1 TRINITY_DN14038_c0_g1~~TRINITY_DN14038_c0_g1_i1.p1  ORF type:complete len:233 (+),score=47.14 TRINITY_DN14038_c0_g1_i1:2-700(+)